MSWLLVREKIRVGPRKGILARDRLSFVLPVEPGLVGEQIRVGTFPRVAGVALGIGSLPVTAMRAPEI